MLSASDIISMYIFNRRCILLIEVKNLTKSYGPVKAVKDISFTLEKGHVYGFLGPNGAGKSTTMNMITGCLAPTKGEIKVNGLDIYDDAIEAKKAIGYLPEIPPLYTDLTPLEYLEFIAGVRKVNRAELYEKLEEIMIKTGILDVSDRLIKNLSKGYKQRVGIAGALVGDPEIIILDEPTVGLDPTQNGDIKDLLRSLKDEHTVVLSSHTLGDISEVCDRIIMISQGKIVADDTIDNLLSGSGEDNEAIIRIETVNSLDDVKAALEGLVGITDITSEGLADHNVIKVHTDKEHDIIKSVILLLGNADISVISITNDRSSLEEVFARLAGESLDAGAAYAMEVEERKLSKAEMKNKKKVVVDSEKGKAYYEEVFVDDEAEAEADDEAEEFENDEETEDNE